MSFRKIRLLPIAFATIAGLSSLFASDHVSLKKPGSLLTEAHAIIGRPLTPMSYAGVARRTTYRAATYGHYGAVVAAPVVVAPVVVAPMCAQVVNVYGQIATVCR
jgi:hypothetical protein